MTKLNVAPASPETRGAEELAKLDERDDLSSFLPSQRLILRLLEIEFGVEDSASLGAEVITDGSNDKKLDAIYVDRDRGILVVAQGYWSTSSAASAKANKASDLTVAASWITSGDLTGVPTNLKSAIEDARQAIGEGSVHEIRFWYCHNLRSSKGVGTEVDQAVAAARQLVAQQYPDVASDITITGQEIGIDELGTLSLRTSIPILVKDEIAFIVEDGFAIRQGSWNAFVTSLDGESIRLLWEKYGELLTAPNVRDFLGLRKSDSNINNAIQGTAVDNPENFWIFNNGLTVLVESYDFKPSKRPAASAILRVRGLGIINGAQTTGALGTIGRNTSDSLTGAKVLVRFVSSADESVLSDVIKFNNTQNKVEAPDFRSKDETQERLRNEFESIPDAEYRGGRRNAGGAAILRPKNLIADRTVGQALAAFHGRPNLAYNETRLIWGDDSVYSSVFSRATSAAHVVFAYSLTKATEQFKQELRAKDDTALTSAERDQLEYFRMRGSIPLFVAAVGKVVETLTQKVIPDLHQASFGPRVSPKDATELWYPIIKSLLAGVKSLAGATEGELKSQEKVGVALDSFASIVNMTASANVKQYQAFGKLVVVVANPGS